VEHLAASVARDTVVSSLERARVRYRFRVYGFVVMLEHVHLLVSELDKERVVNAMQSLKIASALRTARFREFEGRRSPLWQKRSHDRNVSDYAEFIEKLRYIH
jgi:putative transposase